MTANTIETPYVLSQFPPAPSGGACGGLSNLCFQDRACTECAEPGYTCVRGNEWYWQCRDDTATGDAVGLGGHSMTISDSGTLTEGGTLVFRQGGGFCTDIEDCLRKSYGATTSLGGADAVRTPHK